MIWLIDHHNFNLHLNHYTNWSKRKGNGLYLANKRGNQKRYLTMMGKQLSILWGLALALRPSAKREAKKIVYQKDRNDLKIFMILKISEP